MSHGAKVTSNGIGSGLISELKGQTIAGTKGEEIAENISKIVQDRVTTFSKRADEIFDDVTLQTMVLLCLSYMGSVILGGVVGGSTKEPIYEKKEEVPKPTPEKKPSYCVKCGTERQLGRLYNCNLWGYMGCEALLILNYRADLKGDPI